MGVCGKENTTDLYGWRAVSAVGNAIRDGDDKNGEGRFSIKAPIFIQSWHRYPSTWPASPSRRYYRPLPRGGALGVRRPPHQ